MIGRRGLFATVFAGIAMSLLGSCGSPEPDKLFRYNMTVEVETPEGVRSGSSIRELIYSANDNSFPFAESRSSIDLKGEAVVVDLPNGKTLFALLTGGNGDFDYGARIADRSGLWNAKNPWPPEKVMELWPTAPDTEKLKHTSAVPMLVTFKDIKDPTSVQLVDPDDLAATFGSDYRLKAITVQVTDAAVTEGIQRRLGWLGKHPESRLDRSYKGSANPNLSQQLSNGDFRRGQFK